MTYRILILLTSLLLLIGCAETDRDKRLVSIATIVSEKPREALSCLDSISYNELSEADQYYYDLLKIKAKDKAYIKHTSDSAVLRVIEYYSSHNKDNLYPEALYYGARTYCDLGDSPTALIYFHLALDNLTDSTENLDLTANILSQTGRLLTSISLYEQAIPYIERAIRIGEQNRDTINIVYDTQLLGGTYLRAKKYRTAEHYFNKSLNLCSNLPVSYKVKSKMYLADVKYKLGQLDSAFDLIQDTPNLVNSIARNRALASASEIYLEKGLLDSAYIYAQELLNSQDSTYNSTAYQILLSPELQELIPLDTLYQYISDYRGLLENYHDNNKLQLAINQQNFYNYQQHVVKREKLESFNTKLINWILGISSLCFILIVIVLYYKNKHRKALIELHVALKNVDTLNYNISVVKHTLLSSEVNNSELVNGASESLSFANPSGSDILTTKVERNLRENLRNKLLSLYNSNKTVELSRDILESEAYQKIQELIRQKQTLSYEAPLWDELEYAVIKSSPNFKDNLQLLTQSRLTTIDFHTALLIKCQILPSQMAILLSKSKGAIVSRRESLCIKIFGERLGTKVIDGIIRLL